ncbi:MAG: EAL domain-containing protein [Thiovulaceae bacterium]|nr:EAL domain-containing protein [Sulfurimonadaceae bacterium]
MKLSKIALLIVTANGLVIALFSKEIYSYQREIQLRTVSNNIHQNIFRLEGDIKQELDAGNNERVQGILDRTSATNHAIKILSISRDKKVIEFSSSRSQQGKQIGDQYSPIRNILDGLMKDHVLQYKSDFYYFEGAKKHDVELLIQIDDEYVYGELSKIAISYGVSIFLLFSLISIFIFLLIQKFLVIPLEKIIGHARIKKEEKSFYFIDELTELDLTLTNSFKTMIEKQESLKNALEETRYLDAILRTVADINRLLITVKNNDELIMKSVNLLAAHEGYGLCWIGTENKGILEVHTMSSNDFSEQEFYIDMTNQTVDPIFEVFSLGKYYIIEDIQTLKTSNAWIEIAKRNGFGSFIALPLRASIHESSFGVLGLYSLHSNGFEPKEIAMLEELAGDIGFAMRSFQKNQELEHHLTTDAITNLPNRILLVDKLLEMDNPTLSIINLDRFNDINDVYGVMIGDAVLSVYANWLSLKIKANKLISLYKLSGDEFAVLFDNTIELMECKNIVNELILATAHEVHIVNNIEMTLSITVGIASGKERIIEHATAALKRAKMGHKPLNIYIESLSKTDHENNISRYKKIKEAIEESRVVPFFQPIVDNKSRQIIKYEALIRIIRKDGSVMSPILFLDIAKKTRLYGQLTRIMVDKTFEKLKQSTLPISINLSTEDLLNTDLAEYMKKSIELHQIGKKVIFEILETEGIDNYAEVHLFIERFKALGCRFAIDDFGAGYSNFDHLLKLNIDILKIDASLIKNLSSDANARLFVQHINDFSQKIGIETVAEFVADEAIYEEVKKIGINSSQGYYFYEPSADLIEEVIS